MAARPADAKPPEDDTTVYYLGLGLVWIAVCAPASMDAAAVEAQVAATAGSPGTEAGRWMYDAESKPGDDGPNPRPCPDDHDGRRHWMLVC
jgi:hypothetical protein